MKPYPIILLFLGFISAQSTLLAQNNYTDGPIQLEVKLRDIQVNYTASDEGVFGVGFKPDELTFYVWARDNDDLDGSGWQGGTCLTDDFDPPLNSTDFNTTLLNYTYPTATVPQYFDIKFDGWEDESDDGILGISCDGSRCTFDANQCCGGYLFGTCIGITESDDYHCDADPFASNLDYRQGPPCQWYNHGNSGPGNQYLQGGCGTDYELNIESYWRYTKGTACGDAISLGALGAGDTLTHFNSNECYSNNFSNSPGNDVFYSFTVASAIGVKISLCGAQGAQFDSYLYLLDSGCAVDTSDDNSCNDSLSIINKTICVPGTYYVVVDGASASDMGTFTLVISEDTTLSFEANTSFTDVTCNGAADGTGVSTPTGGIAPYTYNWTGGQTDSLATGLGANTYYVTVTDAGSCSTVDSVVITEPIVMTTTSGFTNVSCSGTADGTAWVTPIGGTAPYTYLWSTNPVQQVTDTAIALADGMYYVTVTDSSGCSSVDSATVSTTTIITLTIDTAQNISCFGANDGLINTSVSGGNTPYTYAWSNSASTANLSNLSAANYSVTVYDALGCNVSATANINEPTDLASSITNTNNLSCNGGMDGGIDISISGGTLPYSYMWSNSSTSEDLLNVSAGNYSVTITDANMCADTLTDTLTSPSAITSSIISSGAGCFGTNTGSLDLTVSGGVSPYTYFWSNFSTTEDISALASGSYSVVITDDNGCTSIDTASISGSTEIQLNTVITDGFCDDANTGSVDLSVAGGTSPYTFSWSNSAITEDVTNLAAGSFTVTVTDSNGCTSTTTIEIIGSSTIDFYSISTVPPSCVGGMDGSITAIATGGTPPLRYQWSEGTFIYTNTTSTITGLLAGNYYVTVSDTLGCSTSGSTTIDNPTGLTAIIVTPVIRDVSCEGATDGSISIEATGGAGDYSYNWSTGSSSSSINDIGQGGYTVTVTDADNCQTIKSIEVGLMADFDCPDIPNSFTPNGDAKNDTWVVKNLQIDKVKIFTRWGKLVYESETGYPSPWDGTFNGVQVPASTYFFTITLTNGTDPLSGPVTIVR